MGTETRARPCGVNGCSLGPDDPSCKQWVVLGLPYNGLTTGRVSLQLGLFSISLSLTL